MINIPIYNRKELDEDNYTFIDGEYKYKIIDVVHKKSDSGNMMTVVWFLFEGNPEFTHREHFMHHMINDVNHKMHKATLKRIVSLVDSAGVIYEPDVLSKAKLFGTTGRAFVHLKQNKGEEKAWKRIKNFIEKNVTPPSLPSVAKEENQDPVGEYTPSKPTEDVKFDEDIPF